MDNLINKLVCFAKKNNKLDIPIASFIIDDKNKLLSISKNNKEKKHSPTGHAEIIAINKLSKKLKSCYLNDYTIITTLEPCPMCYFAILEARIKKIIYLAKDYKKGFLNGPLNYYENTNPKIRPDIVYIENKEASDIVTDFFKKIRKF